eukprot:1440824-Lingulodinium_polyedra.AAC.1
MEKSGVVRRMLSTSLWMACAMRRSPWIRRIPCGVMRIAPLPHAAAIHPVRRPGEYAKCLAAGAPLME